MFDENIVKFVIIVFTGGDRMKKEKLSLDHILENSGPTFKQVLEECGQRVIVFNNLDSKRNKKAKVRELLDTTNKIYRDNEESPYRCTVQERVGEKLEETVTSNVQELIEKDPRLKEFFAQMETRIKEKDELAATHNRRMEESFIRKRKIQEEEEILKAEEQRKREDEERKNEEEKKKQEEEEARKEAKKKAKEEKEKKKKQEEERRLLELEKEKIRLEKEALKEKEEAERLRREKEGLERQREAEREKQHKEEMERQKNKIVDGQETSWVEDVASGAWKAFKGLFL